jgi:SMI1 / KNR4 family (SUKH-1)
MIWRAPRLPAILGVIPIAIGPGGDYVCLDFREAKPTVGYWHHERSGQPDELTQVAGSFSEFTSLLYEPDLEAESALD